MSWFHSNEVPNGARLARLAPFFALALAACIPDQGTSKLDDDGGAAGDDSGTGDDSMTSDDGGQDADAPPVQQTVTRKIDGMSNDSWVITDENGKPGADGPGTLDVPANAKVHFILSSDPAGEVHKFMIMIPGFETANVNMPALPGNLPLDWTAPPTKQRYVAGINCTAHKNMVADIVVQ